MPFSVTSTDSCRIFLKNLFVILLALGFILRLGYGIARYEGNILHLSGTAFITSWNHDGLEHVLIAKALDSGEGYIVDDMHVSSDKGVRYPGQEALFKAPLYQFFLAAVFAISGFSFKLFFPLQALLGGATSGLVGLIAWEAFGQKTTAWLAGIAAAVHPILVNAASQPYNEDLFFFLFAAAIWLFLVWFRTRGLRYAVLCGASIGLCTLTRESGLPLLAAMCAVAIGSRLRDPRAWTASALLAGTALALIAPWSIRNAVRFHAFIPVATIVGEDLSTGNNECVAEEGLLVSYWAEGPCPALNQRIAELGANAPASTLPACVRYDGLSRRAALDFIGQQPLVYVKLAIRRFWTALLPFAPRGNQRFHERVVLSIYWVAVFPAGIIGMVLCLRRPHSRTVLLTFIIGLSFLSIMAVLYWSDLRFRVGIDLLLGCFAAWFYTNVVQRKDVGHVEFEA